MQRVCRIFGLARSTAYYLKARGAIPVDQRPVPGKRGPVGAATDAEPVARLRAEVGRLTRDDELPGRGCRHLEGGRPFVTRRRSG